MNNIKLRGRYTFPKSIQFPKKGVDTSDHIFPHGAADVYSPHFRGLHMLMVILYQENNLKLLARTSVFPGGHPLTKSDHFTKMSKIGIRIKVQEISLFYKKGAKFPKNAFGQNRPIFTLGGQVVYTAPFLPGTSVNCR